MNTNQSSRFSRTLLLSAAAIASAMLPTQTLSQTLTPAETRAQHREILSTMLPTSPESGFDVKLIGGN